MPAYLAPTSVLRKSQSCTPSARRAARAPGGWCRWAHRRRTDRLQAATPLARTGERLGRRAVGQQPLCLELSVHPGNEALHNRFGVDQPVIEFARSIDLLRPDVGLDLVDHADHIQASAPAFVSAAWVSKNSLSVCAQHYACVIPAIFALWA